MIAAYSDVQRKRIPNLLIVVIFIHGIITSYMGLGLTGSIDRVLCLFCILLILYPLYMSGSLGSGDVKLYALLPLYYPRERLLIIYLLVFFAAAILCLVYLLFFPENRRQIRQFYDYLKFQLFGYNFNQGGIPKLQLGRIPMALPMAVGILISIVFDNMGIVEFY